MRGVGLKSHVDRQQSAKYYCQFPPRLLGQHTQRLLPRMDGKGPILLALPFPGNLAVQTKTRKRGVPFPVSAVMALIN